MWGRKKKIMNSNFKKIRPFSNKLICFPILNDWEIFLLDPTVNFVCSMYRLNTGRIVLTENEKNTHKERNK